MRAYKLPYPPPKDFFPPEFCATLGYFVPQQLTLDFPERHLSYLLVGCTQADLPQCVEEVGKAVEHHRRGEEPPLLEIRFRHAN
ncbi:MAG TPA: hypothetical protein VFI72_15860 [Candidatus Angelobacter sp.]|nr:hypothetical protein [Candidatus Angelobacter sp.]